MINGYNQYKDDFFNKLDFPFKKGKKLLDVGCGEGSDGEIFEKEYGVKFYGTDVYEDPGMKQRKLPFKIGSIYKIPYPSSSFDYIFVHDVIHHIDEPKHREKEHIKGLKELLRVCKTGGQIIIAEGNRYNPLFFPHMVKMRRHEHLAQQYFVSIMKKAYRGHDVSFKFFEAHAYPHRLLLLFKIYEFIMEHILPHRFIGYNVAIIKK